MMHISKYIKKRLKINFYINKLLKTLDPK